MHGHSPGLQGAIELRLNPSEFLDRVAALIPLPRKHRHRYFRVLAALVPMRQAARMQIIAALRYE